MRRLQNPLLFAAIMTAAECLIAFLIGRSLSPATVLAAFGVSAAGTLAAELLGHVARSPERPTASSLRWLGKGLAIAGLLNGYHLLLQPGRQASPTAIMLRFVVLGLLGLLVGIRETRRGADYNAPRSQGPHTA